MQDAQVGHQRSTILSFEPMFHSQKPTSRPLKWRFHLAKAKVGENSTNYTRKHQHCQKSRNAIGAAEPCRLLLLPELPHSIPAPSFIKIPPATRSARANRLLAWPTHRGMGVGTASGPHLQVLTATEAFATSHLLGEAADQATLKKQSRRRGARVSLSVNRVGVVALAAAVVVRLPSTQALRSPFATPLFK